MARFLVHIATGPENPTRAALGLLVARTATAEHEVRIFLAGDAVHLADEETAASVNGLGTGAAAEHLAALREAGVPIFLSKMSAQARDIAPPDWTEAAPPDKLVELAAWSETALVY
jgi:predicted peroxiredoxin